MSVLLLAYCFGSRVRTDRQAFCSCYSATSSTLLQCSWVLLPSQVLRLTKLKVGWETWLAADPSIPVKSLDVSVLTSVSDLVRDIQGLY